MNRKLIIFSTVSILLAWSTPAALGRADGRSLYSQGSYVPLLPPKFNQN
jgi:hypothetical protein